MVVLKLLSAKGAEDNEIPFENRRVLLATAPSKRMGRTDEESTRGLRTVGIGSLAIGDGNSCAHLFQ